MSDGQKRKSCTKGTGSKGEEIAATYLARKGYHILSRNYRCRYGEIDIVARDGETLVFVEVKAGRSKSFGAPETWVDRRKQEHLGNAAASYLEDHEIDNVDCRFDVVAIWLGRNGPRVQHIENAFWL